MCVYSCRSSSFNATEDEPAPDFSLSARTGETATRFQNKSPRVRMRSWQAEHQTYAAFLHGESSCT